MGQRGGGRGQTLGEDKDARGLALTGRWAVIGEGTVTTDGGAPKVLPCSHGHIRQTQGAPGGRWTFQLRGEVSVSGSLGGQSS